MSLVFKLTFMYFHGYNIPNASTPGLLKYAETRSRFGTLFNSLKQMDKEGKDLIENPDNLKRKRN